MLISFSGLDGAGKTTQIKTLLKYYEKRGAKVGSIYSIFPDIRYHSTDDLVKAYQILRNYDVIHLRYRLNSDKNSKIMQKLEQLPLPLKELAIKAAIQGYHDHCELNEHLITPLKEMNKTIIFDRYYYDELVYKSVYGCPDHILAQLYNNATNTDVRFYIYISAEECFNRNRLRPDSKVNLYQKKEYVVELLSRFRWIAEQNNLITIDGGQEREDISKLVLQHINF